MENFQVVEDHAFSYFTMIPHLIDDIGLSIYGYRLYCHLKRIAGENGSCWQTQDRLAKFLGVSSKTIVRTKSELIKAGLIKLEQREIEGHWRHCIVIIDVWPENFEKYSPALQQAAVSMETEGDTAVSKDTDIGFRPAMIKNTQVRIPNNLSSASLNELAIIDTWRGIKGFRDSPEKCLELLRRISAEFPEVDILAESKAWAARKLSEPLTKRTRPLGQLWNWMRKADEFQKERRGYGKNKELGAGKSSRLRESVGTALRS